MAMLIIWHTKTYDIFSLNASWVGCLYWTSVEGRAREYTNLEVTFGMPGDLGKCSFLPMKQGI